MSHNIMFYIVSN